jgi:hypothetical protein
MSVPSADLVAAHTDAAQFPQLNCTKSEIRDV